MLYWINKKEIGDLRAFNKGKSALSPLVEKELGRILVEEKPILFMANRYVRTFIMEKA